MYSHEISVPLPSKSMLEKCNKIFFEKGCLSDDEARENNGNRKTEL